MVNHKVSYIGKAEYCYANSAAMLLSSIGEDVKPELIEAIAGIGLGAFVAKHTNLLFFSPWAVAPDVALTESLHVLGFEFEERSFNQEDPPFNELREVLNTSPVLIGPLDMGYLIYQKHSHPPYGADHFVLVYGIDENNVYLHDPYGYPHASLTFNELKPAWKADNIGYKLGPYHWWHSIIRKGTPTEDQVYKKTKDFFKHIYLESDKRSIRENKNINQKAILEIADKLQQKELNAGEIGFLTGFSLPVSAKRAMDYSSFFRTHNKKLSNIKSELAVLFGHTQVLLMGKELVKASENLTKIAEKEGEFREELFKP